ncbi:FG-GAP-like repeat-containing protein, partial [Acidobacteriota bacterium]
MQMNPDIMNPDIMNPDIMNPSIDDPLAGQFTDVAWMVKNVGNTTSSYVFKTLSTAAREDGTLPEGIQAQLLIYQIYKTPDEYSGDGSCELGVQEHHDLVLNIINPDIMNPDIMNSDFLNPDIMNPDIMNATFSLAPDAEAQVILRLWKPDQSGTVTTATGKILNFNDPNSILDIFRIHVSGAARNSDDLEDGITTYPDDSSDFMIDTKILPPGEVGVPYEAFMSASGGTEPYSWASLDSLPGGLNLDPGPTKPGRVWGTPTTPGTFSFQAQVTDGGGQVVTKEVWINIFPAASTGYTITGRVVTSTGAGIEGVELDGLPGMSGTGDPVITDDVGYYTGYVDSGWDGTVTPTKPGYTFVPSSRTYTDVTSNQTVQNYTGTSLFGTLDHFEFDSITDQTTGTLFSITITAKDSSGDTVTSYNGTNSLSLSQAGTIDPTTTDNFVNGVWSGNVTIITSHTGVQIQTEGDARTGASNSFDVVPVIVDQFTKVSTGDIVTDGGVSTGCAWEDYNNDGYLDLFVSNYDENNFLYTNNQDGTFTKVISGDIVTDGGLSQGCAWGDYDNDGYPDLFVANQDGQNNFLYTNNGDGSFTKVTNEIVVTDGGHSASGAWGDYDNDGDLDLFVANSDYLNNFLYTNNGNGSFTKVTSGVVVMDGENSTSGAWGDYDNDGDLDLFVADTY